MRKFIIISPGFPRDEQDSTCLPTIQQFVLSCKQQRPDLSVIVISLQYPLIRKNYLWNGVQVYSMGGKNKGGVRRVLTWIRAYRQLQKTGPKGCIGVLSLWLHESALLGKLFSRSNKLTHFIWMQGQDAKVINRYVKLVNPRAQEVLAISESNKQELMKNHNILTTYIVENGLNPEEFPPLNVSDRSIDVLGVGSLIALKRWVIFIDTIKVLQQDFPRLRCLIIGDGPDKHQLIQKIERENLSGIIILKGNLDHREVLKTMAQSRILLHPSEYEGNSTVVLEALFSGCQVISCTSAGGTTPDSFHLCKSGFEIIKKLRHLLTEKKVPVRPSVNTIHETARRIISLFEENLKPS